MIFATTNLCESSLRYAEKKSNLMNVFEYREVLRVINTPIGKVHVDIYFLHLPNLL